MEAVKKQVNEGSSCSSQLMYHGAGARRVTKGDLSRGLYTSYSVDARVFLPRTRDLWKTGFICSVLGFTAKSKVLELINGSGDVIK